MADRIRRIVTYGWPLATALFFIPFGADSVLAYVVLWGVTGPLFFLLPCVAAEVDILYWHWFFGWSGNLISHAGKVRQAINEFNAEGLPREAGYLKEKIGHFLSWAVALVEDSINPKESWKRRFVLKMVDLVRRFPPALGYAIVASTLLIPGVGFYIGLIVCRASKKKIPHALLVLLVANLGKVLFFSVLAYLALHR